VRRTVAIVVALAVGSAGVALASSGGPTRLEEKALVRAHAKNGFVYTLRVGGFYRRRDGRANAIFTLNKRSSHETSGGDAVEIALADRRRAVEGMSFTEGDRCRGIVIFGSGVHAASRFVAVRQDGSRRRLRRQSPPRSWHYSGWLVAAYTGKGPPTEHISVFDRHGRRLGAIYDTRDVSCPRVR
jgi:hypothetical protein